jgi:DNA-binding beta-propeller fold protein YncE
MPKNYCLSAHSLAAVTAAWLFVGGGATHAQTTWGVVNTLMIGGEGSWDYLTVDPATHRLYVPRTTHTMVIDGDSGKTIADIPGQKIAHGVAIVPSAGRGFISDGGGDGAVIVFDLKTYAVLGSIAALPDADGIIFDPVSGRVLVVSGRGKALMSLKPDLDPKTGAIDAPIGLGGEPEFLATDASGKVYVNLMDTNEVAVVDFTAKKVVARWPVAPGGAPVGMSIDPAKGRLFIGCRQPQRLIVMSTIDGKVQADLPIGESVDATKVEGGQVFASTAGGVLSVAGETSAGGFAIVQTVKTGQGARTMGVDPTTHRIYLPTADFEPGASGRMVAKPGTFKILVVARGAQ